MRVARTKILVSGNTRYNSIQTTFVDDGNSNNSSNETHDHNDGNDNGYQEGQEEGVNYTSVDANLICKKRLTEKIFLQNTFQYYQRINVLDTYMIEGMGNHQLNGIDTKALMAIEQEISQREE